MSIQITEIHCNKKQKCLEQMQDEPHCTNESKHYKISRDHLYTLFCK